MSLHRLDIASVRAQYSWDLAGAPEGTPIGTDAYVRFLSDLLEQRDRQFAPGSEPLPDRLIPCTPLHRLDKLLTYESSEGFQDISFQDIDRLMAPLRTAVQAVREEARRIEAAGGFEAGRLADKPELLAKVEAALEYIASGEMAAQFRLAGEQAEYGDTFVQHTGAAPEQQSRPAVSTASHDSQPSRKPGQSIMPLSHTWTEPGTLGIKISHTHDGKSSGQKFGIVLTSTTGKVELPDFIVNKAEDLVITSIQGTAVDKDTPYEDCRALLTNGTRPKTIEFLEYSKAEHSWRKEAAAQKFSTIPTHKYHVFPAHSNVSGVEVTA